MPVFDNLHPTHGDHDYDIAEHEEHHHLEDHLEDEDPYHGVSSVGYVEKESHKPVTIPVVSIPSEGHPSATDAGTSSRAEEELVDHKLSEAHGSINNKIAAIMALKESSSPGPTPATPVHVHDSVAHHPRLVSSHQKYDFPNRNPSPTSPILVKARLVDATFGDEAQQMAFEDNRAEDARTETASARSIKSAQRPQQKTEENAPSAVSTKEQKSKKTIIASASLQQNPDWNSVIDNAMRVYNSAAGQKGGIAKKK